MWCGIQILKLLLWIFRWVHVITNEEALVLFSMLLRFHPNYLIWLVSRILGYWPPYFECCQNFSWSNCFHLCSQTWCRKLTVFFETRRNSLAIFIVTLSKEKNFSNVYQQGFLIFIFYFDKVGISVFLDNFWWNCLYTVINRTCPRTMYLLCKINFPFGSF